MAIEKLIEEFAKLPGIGYKTAQRLTLYVLNLPKEEVEGFAAALVKASGTIKYCSVCGNYTDTDPCAICSNPNRDKKYYLCSRRTKGYYGDRKGEGI